MTRRTPTWPTAGLTVLAACLMAAAVPALGTAAPASAGASASPAGSALTLTPHEATPASAALEPSATTLSALLAAAETASPSASSGGNPLCCQVIANPATGDKPAGMAIDTAANLVFISDWSAGEVTVLSGTYPYTQVGWSPVNVGAGAYPNGEAFDPLTCTVWVALWGNDHVTEISDGDTAPYCPGPAPAAGTIVASISLPSPATGPYGIAYDPDDEVMLVTDQGYGTTGQPQEVTVICAQATVTCESSTPPMTDVALPGYPLTTTGPRYVAWDPVDDYFVATDPTGPSGPVVALFACTAGIGCLTTSNWGYYGDVSLPAGSVPSGIAYAGTGTYDALSGGTGTFWVGDGSNDEVSVICTATSQFVTGSSCSNLTFYPPGVGYDFSFTVPAGTSPSGVAFFPPCDELFITGSTADDVLVYHDEVSTPALRATVDVGVAPLAAIYDGEVITSNYGSQNVSVILCSACNATPCSYSINFTESGLPAGTTWDVDLNGMPASATVTTTGQGMTINFADLCVGNYTYVVSVPPGYGTTNPGGTVSIPAGSAPGTELSVSVPFTQTCTYTVTLNETGLPTGTIWSVTLNGVTLPATVSTTGGHSITFSGLCAGSYAFQVTAPKGYTANPSSGTVVIPAGSPSGTEVYQAIAFQNLEFTESGLPAGIPWDVTISGRGVKETNITNGTLISLSVPKGTYRYNVSKPCEYKAAPLSGSVTVRNAVVVVHVVFTLLTKVVKFKETGLPHGTSWSVNVTGPEPFAPFTVVTTTYTSTSSTIAVRTVCGSYTWNASSAVVGPTSYFPHPASGTFTITVTGNTIKKVPPANPIAIKYAP